MERLPASSFPFWEMGRLLFAVIVGCCFVTQQVEAAAVRIGSWDYVLKHDPDGKPRAAFARLRGDNGSLLWLTCSKASQDDDLIQVMSFAAAVYQKGYLGRSTSRGRSTIIWFDESSPELGYWTYQDRLGMLSGQDQVTTFVDRIARSQTLVIDLSNYRYETKRSEFHFNENDTKAITERFKQDCRNIVKIENAES